MSLKKHIHTQLSDPLLKHYMKWKKEHEINSDYEAVRVLIQNGLAEGRVENIAKGVDPENLPSTGDHSNDVKILSTSYSKKDLEKALRRLDGKNKIKNIVKKTGAFHDQRALLDIMSLVNRGRPTLMEIKYHVDYWVNVSRIANAIADKGGLRSVLATSLEDVGKPRPGIINRANYLALLAEDERAKI